MTFFLIFLSMGKLFAHSIRQSESDTIYFSKGSDKINSKLRIKLDSLAAELIRLPKIYLFISGYKRKGQSSQMSFSRSNKILNYLVEKHNVNRDNIMMNYGIMGRSEMVIISLSETKPPSCDNPPFPGLKK